MDHQPLPVHRHRVPKVAVALLVAALVGGVVTWIGLYLHYAHAPALVAQGEWKWAGQGINEAEPLPDAALFDRADDLTASMRVRRPGDTYSFYVLVANTSSVTQRVLGLSTDEDDGMVAEPIHVAVSTSSVHGSGYMTDPESLQYRLPQAFGPGDVRWIRMTERTSTEVGWHSRLETFDDLYLDMHIGGFDTEQVIALDAAMVLYGLPS